MALSGVTTMVAQGRAHISLKWSRQLREQGIKQGWRWKKGSVSNPGSLQAVSPHMSAHSVRAFVQLSTQPLPPVLLTMLAAFGLIPAVRIAFLTHKPQLSGATCWICTLSSSSCTWSKAVPERPWIPFHSPGEGWEAIKSTSTRNLVVRELRTDSSTHLQVSLWPAKEDTWRVNFLPASAVWSGHHYIITFCFFT